MPAAIVMATYIGTHTVTSFGRPLVVYRTETHERTEPTGAGRLVHDKVTYTVTSPPSKPTLDPDLDEVTTSETIDRTLIGSGPSEFVAHVDSMRITRNYFGDAGGRNRTFHASFRSDSVARVEHEEIYSFGTGPGQRGPAGPADSDRTTTIAADGSFQRIGPLPGDAREIQKSDGSYSYFFDIPGFSYVDYRYTPVVEDGLLTGIAFLNARAVARSDTFPTSRRRVPRRRLGWA